MVKSLYSGVSGLKTHQSKMDVIGNNIANVNTTGYKTSVVTFKDVYYQTKISASAGTATLGGINPAQVGYGVQLGTTTANLSQSGFTYTDSQWDMAIDGNGFFQVMDGAGNIYYTRAGAFTVDADGYLVNSSGYHVLGVTGDSDGVSASSEAIRIVIPDTEANCSSATKTVNGVNVTLSVSAPSDNTDMTVTFTEAEYPYATYSNGILNIFFNSDTQYDSEEAFEYAIQQALDAGGITLPDNVSLNFEFESIPDNPEAVTAANSISGFNYSTENDSVVFYQSYTQESTTGTTSTKHAYISFATDSVRSDSSKINVDLVYDPSGEVTATYDSASLTWTITVTSDVTASEINAAISEYQTDTDATAPNLTCTSLVLPSTSLADTRDEVLTAMADMGTLTTQGTTEGSVDIEVEATVAGEYANDYKITFAYVSGYGRTSAVWDGDNLTITVCNDTTLADINEKIRTAANGNEKKIIKVTTLTGLKQNSVSYSTASDGTVTRIETDPNGVQKITTGASEEAADANAESNTGVTYQFADGSTDGAADAFKTEPTTDTNYMVPEEREAFFGGNPAISPTGGADSFFTGVAKSLSTFALTDGRTGGEQSLESCDVTIQTDGTIIGYHPVHGYITLGRIDLAIFENANGLAQVSGTLFAETVASGSPTVVIAGGDEGGGSVLSNTLEMSNVDLSQEFTDMITTQRGFQANSRVITVSDTMLEELLSLKR